ncbi:PAXNEB-domain-containing protein [Aaosphaeria arxii CBS 175.79]|uniref:Elongator complex protein 4 n=1 Tax=Aaosphaeria arxii CBS 175.79 TaxID=1450172 RepID=A0A6A5XB06_9PLEO|nr:PAXNEB-domain-containing protein [Aaosphaeria arxii CBS 175.79]KAF2009954.1 PAXNEB-domain-containing protein [Aaosphaeria arxii CBS 175.79]
MAFRKRNVALTRSDPSSDTVSSPTSPQAANVPQPSPGVRPSPIDGRPTTSTGTPSLDAVLAGHAGLALGNSLLIGESGTTDYAGALLRFYASEGVLQGHVVHVVGLGEVWGRELPGIAESRDEEKRRQRSEREEKMKIAWRYESLGEFGGRNANRVPTQTKTDGAEAESIFCHTFDLAKRLSLPSNTSINYIQIPRTAPQASPFTGIIQNLQQKLETSPPSSIHRLIIPSILSPAYYPPSSSQPQHVLQFLHALRALLRQYPTRLTAISTIPLSLYPRSTGLIRWMEHLSDGVFELSPFPYSASQALSTSSAATKEEERPQGMFAVHKLPVWSDKGGGGAVEGLGEDLAFTLSRRKFTIAKFSLPPMEGDQEAQEEAMRDVAGERGKTMPSKAELEF